MLRRFLLSAAVLAGIFLACFGHLVWRGAHARKITLENFPTPHWSTGRPLAADTRPTLQPGRVYDLTFVPAAEGDVRPPQGSHLLVQLATEKTRIVVVRKGHPNTSVSWWDVLLGRERVQILPDRGWVDLGEFPAEGEPLEAQIVGILPGAYGFYEIFTDTRPAIARVRISRPDSPRARPLRILPRYRFVVPAPISAKEVLARYFFFFAASPVLAVCGFLAVGLLFAGWFWLGEGDVFAVRAVGCLVSGVVILHSACLPPLEGADETSHVATVEALVFRPGIPYPDEPYPGSIDRLIDATGHLAAVYDAEIPLALDTAEVRERARAELRSTPDAQPLAVNRIRDGYVEGVDLRAPAFFRPYALLAPVFRHLALIDRVSLYRIAASAAMCLAFLAALWIARRVLPELAPVPTLGLVALLPHVVFTAGTCSNYAPAIGLGFLFATCLLVALLAPDAPTRRRFRLLLLAGSLVGIPVWPDFVLLFVVAVFFVLAAAIWERFSTAPRRIAALAAALAAAAGVVFVISRLKVLNLGTRLPQVVPRWGDSPVPPMLAIVLAPLLAGLLFTAILLRAGTLPPLKGSRLLAGVSLAILLAVLVSFALTPFTRTSTDIWMPFPEYASNWFTAVVSNNLSWDQDFLSFKTYWGAFGWLEGLLPDWLYAVSRWACVAALVLLPFLARKLAARDRAAAAALAVAAGAAASLAATTEVIRFLAPTQPVGRFILPVLPLCAIPLLALATDGKPSRIARGLLRALVVLQVWVAVAGIGSRYFVGALRP